jgi:hypothetical protein
LMVFAMGFLRAALPRFLRDFAMGEE